MGFNKYFSEQCFYLRHTLLVHRGLYICDALRDLVLVVVCSLKNVKNSHGGVSLFVKSQASGSNSTNSNTPP